jgi:hypothetical protein
VVIVADLPWAPALAQATPPADSGQNPVVEVPAPDLTIDQDRQVGEYAFGLRVPTVLEARTAALAAQNSRIQAEHLAEEQARTEQRPNLGAEEFRARADAFDDKVKLFRAEQEAMSRAIVCFRET